MKLAFDVPFDCPDSIRPHLQKVFDGEYEVSVDFAQGSSVLDLGANCGAFSVWAAHRWPGSSIYAYEPHPENFNFFLRNTMFYSNVTGFNVAVGKPGLRPLYDGTFNCGEMSLFMMRNNERLTGQHVEVIDPLTLPEANVLKMDIEGCEIEVLAPLIEAGRKFDVVLFEYHNEILRREADRLLRDYALIGSTVEHPIGRGVCKYIHQDIYHRMFP